MDQYKPIIMEQIRKHIKLDKKVFIEFFLLYPGICKDADVKTITHFEYRYNDDQLTTSTMTEKPKICHEVRRDLAPAITKELCTDKVSLYERIKEYCCCGKSGEDKYIVESNVGWRDFEKDTIFGKYNSIPISCPDGKWGCLVAHHKIRITLDSKHIEVRKQFNSKEWKYEELLSLWEKYYDKKMEEKASHIYEEILLTNEKKLIGLLTDKLDNTKRIEKFIKDFIKQ
jgi:hypothetical protein